MQNLATLTAAVNLYSASFFNEYFS